MLNYLWAGMIILAVVFGAATGRLHEVGTAALTSAGDAVTLCLTMLGILSFWMGLMRIAKSAGLIDRLTKLLSPFLHFLFPRIPSGHPALFYIASNLIANFLGLGWAATPFGLKAMEGLSGLQKERNTIGLATPSPTHSLNLVSSGVASDEMCTFLILNISSLQLIPVNLIAYRTEYGSTAPTAIIIPAILATLFSSLIAIIFCKIASRSRRF